MPNRGAKAAAIMVVYAVLLVLGGLIAFLMAPEGANAATAIIIPSVCAVIMLLCAALAWRMPASRRMGMIGIHLGLAFTLIFALGIGSRAWPTTQTVARYHQAVGEFEAATTGADPAASEQTLAEYLAAQDLPDHDKTYLRNMLWALTALSVGAFIALLLARPAPSDRGGAGANEPRA